jgi:uncharacterized protein YdeI (BOF family)
MRVTALRYNGASFDAMWVRERHNFCMNLRFLKNSSAALMALTMGVTALHAYPPGPPPAVTPVGWILQTKNNDRFDDKRVVMVGQVTHHDDGTDWWFTDGTGSVRLENNDRRLPVGPTLRIVGRIDQATWGIGVIEVQVKHWSYANPPRPQ